MGSDFGAFGKIPALGDFLRLNLAADFIANWDSWLQSAMVAARAALAERWNDCYMSAPIWRFSCPPGLAGHQAVSGVLMASVDSVGRQFPLTLAASCGPGDSVLRHFGNTGVFERLEDIALDVLDQETGRDDLANAVSGLTFVQPSPSQAPSDRYSGSSAPELSLAAREVARVHANAAIWTAEVDQGHRMLLTSALPDKSQFLGLFDLSAPVWNSERAGGTA